MKCDFCGKETEEIRQCGRCKRWYCKECDNGNPNQFEGCPCRVSVVFSE